MSTRQLQQALDAADERMTMLGLDMCVEAEIEVAYQIRNTGPQILVASQYMESRNWPYHLVFQQLRSELGRMSLEGLAENSSNETSSVSPLGLWKWAQIAELLKALGELSEIALTDCNPQSLHFKNDLPQDRI